MIFLSSQKINLIISIYSIILDDGTPDNTTSASQDFSAASTTNCVDSTYSTVPDGAPSSAADAAATFDPALDDASSAADSTSTVYDTTPDSVLSSTDSNTHATFVSNIGNIISDGNKLVQEGEDLLLDVMDVDSAIGKKRGFDDIDNDDNL